jgi:hypothetical protein
MELRKHERQIWPDSSARTKVVAPVRHEGVGNALRTAYIPRTSDMPSDMADLLDKLC